MKTRIEQTLHVHNRVHRALPAQPFHIGLPWPKGRIRAVENLVLRDARGGLLPAAFRELNCWPDGSLQWVLLDASLDLPPSETVAIQAALAGRNETIPAPNHPVLLSIDATTAVLGNGRIEVVVSNQPGELMKSWTMGLRPQLRPNGMDITFHDDTGKRFSLCRGPRRFTVEHASPLRVVLRLDGKHAADDGTELLDYSLRFEVYADRSDMKITYAFRNREQPVPGLRLSNWYMEVATAMAPEAERCFTANNLTRHYLTRALRVREDPEIVASDTGDLDHYVDTHKDNRPSDCFVRDAAVLHDPPDDKPWFLKDPQFRLQAGGNRCVWPYLALLQANGGCMASILGMTCLHPKSLSVRGTTFRIGIYPDWAGSVAITQGAGRSHTIALGSLPAQASDADIQNQYLAWEFGGVHTHVSSGAPVEIALDPAHVARCKVFAVDKLPPYDPGKRFLFERKVLDSWMGVSYGQLGAVDQVTTLPAAGFWHYGDSGLGNNEEMAALPYLQNYLRTGNWGCADVALAMVTHMMEVDHVAFSVDPFQNGGMVAHCLHHNDGAAYPSHMWFTELLIAFALTGNPEFKQTALRACENLLHWVNTEDGFLIISSDQREAGQTLINLTWCYQFNRDPRYLAACRKIIYEYLMANAARLGRMLGEKPRSMPVKICSYGDYASWEGMFWYWEITRDKALKRFLLKEFKWRLTPDYCGVHGGHRVTDYNPAAYAYWMTGNRRWMDRVARPFRAAFRAARWPIGWVHAMYYIKVAFELGIIHDDDILAQ